MLGGVGEICVCLGLKLGGLGLGERGFGLCDLVIELRRGDLGEEAARL